MLIIINPEWLSIIIAAATLVLAIATFIQARKTKTLTDVVNELNRQAQQSRKQTQSLKNMVILMTRDQITKNIPSLSNAHSPTKSNTYLLELNHAGAMILRVNFGPIINGRKVLLECREKKTQKKPTETFEFEVNIIEYPIYKDEKFEFFVHFRGALGMEFIQNITLVAKRDHTIEKRDFPVSFNFQFNYSVPAAQPIQR